MDTDAFFMSGGCPFFTGIIRTFFILILFLKILEN